MRRTLENKVILLTGANAGLGWALLQQILPYAKKVIAVDRNIENLETLASMFPKTLVSLQIDLSLNDQLAHLSTFLESSPVDVFINNAGITHIKTFRETDLESFNKVMDVNFYAPVYISKSLLNNGLKSIISINSIAGVAPLYARSAYVSSKFALNGFMQTLATEENIELMQVFPSFINTGIRTQAKSEGKKGFAQKNASFLEPKEVAIRIIKAYQKGKRNLRLGKMAKAALWFSFLFPRIYVIVMKRKNNKLWRN